MPLQAACCNVALGRLLTSVDCRFLSHTWHTPGRLKFWSLLLAFNWHFALFGCYFGTSLALLLYAFDVVPMPMIYAAQWSDFGQVCPLGPWALLLTPFCGAVALLLSPYCPRRQSDNIFFDLASWQKGNAGWVQDICLMCPWGPIDCANRPSRWSLLDVFASTMTAIFRLVLLSNRFLALLLAGLVCVLGRDRGSFVAAEPVA